MVYFIFNKFFINSFTIKNLTLIRPPLVKG